MNVGCAIALVLFPLAMLVAIIGAIVESSKKRKRQKQELISSGATLYVELPHTAGLPIAENVLCKIYSLPDRIEIKGGGTQFTLLIIVFSILFFLQNKGLVLQAMQFHKFHQLFSE